MNPCRLLAVPQDGHVSDTAKNKKPRGSWGGGLSPVSLSAISPSPVLPSLDRDCSQSIYTLLFKILSLLKFQTCAKCSCQFYMKITVFNFAFFNALKYSR